MPANKGPYYFPGSFIASGSDPSQPLPGGNGAELALAVKHIAPASAADFIAVRLSNGVDYYTASGGSFSGSISIGQVDQGNPNLLSFAWPVKVTDGTNVFGTLSSPMHVLLASGGLGVGTQTNPLWVTGSTGAGGGSGGSVTTQSGSVTGLLLGGVNVSSTNPLPITGSVGLTAPVVVSNFPATQNVTVLSGSVSGILVGGQSLSSTNPVPVTGSIGLSGPVAVSNFPANQTVTVSNFPATQDVSVVSGSITGLLLGGVAVSSTNPLPVTGSVGLSGPVAVSNFPSTQNVIALSGSVSGLLLGGVAVSSTNPLPVTGSVGITSPVAVSNFPNNQNVTALSGSVSGLLVGGQALSSTNPVPVTGSVGITGPITGSVGLSGPVAVSNFPATQNVTVLSGSVSGLLNGGVIVSSTNPLPVTGSVGLAGPVAVSNFPANQSVTQGTSPWIVSGSVGLTEPITGSVGLSGPVAVSNFPANQNVTVVSGSVTGLLLGGVSVSSANPIPVTGSVGITAPVTAVVSNFPSTQNVVALTGSITGLLVGGQPVSFTNQVPVTGSVGLTGPVAVSNFPATQNVTVLSGSVSGLLLGGVAVSSVNPLPVTGSVGITAPVTISNFPANQSVTQGTSPWIVSGSVGLTGPITGSVGLTGPVAISNFPATQAISSSFVVQTRDAPVAASTTTLTSSLTPQRLFTLKPSRSGFSIYNDSIIPLLIRFAADPVFNAFTARLEGGGYYESPFGSVNSDVFGVWIGASATGSAMLTEYI